MKLLDALDVDDGGALNTQEPGRVESRLQPAHRPADEVRRPPGVYANINVLGLYPVYLVNAEKEDAPRRFNDDALQIPSARLEVLQQGRQASVEVVTARLGDLGLGALKRLLKPLLTERLQQVIQRVHLEGFERIFVVGGDEDDGGHQLGADLGYHVEARHLRHLHVEKNQIRLMFGNRLDRLLPVGALADDGDVGITLKQHPHPVARQRLVVNYQRPDFFH